MPQENKETPLDSRVPGPYCDYHKARHLIILEPPEFFSLAGKEHDPPIPHATTQIDCAVMLKRKKDGKAYEFPAYVTEFVAVVRKQGPKAYLRYHQPSEASAECALHAA